MGKILKMHKNMLKTSLQHIAVVLCKKNGSKKQIIFEKGDYFENCKNGHKVNAIDFAKSSGWVKY